MSVAIRAAASADSALIFDLVRELADYEKLSGKVDATPEAIAAALFAQEPRLYCDIAEWSGEPAGFSVWFLNFPTFRGRHGIYLEDIFVRPAFRRRGIGKACSSGWRNAASMRAMRVSNGRCSLGTSRPLISIAPLARKC